YGTQIANEQQDDKAGQQASIKKMFLERRHRAFDEDGIVADDLHADAWREIPLDLFEPCLGRCDHVERVTPGLPLQAEHNSLPAAVHVPGSGIRVTIFDMPEIADVDRHAVEVGDDDLIELSRRGDAAQRAYTQFGFAAPNRAARHLHILILN